MDEQPGCVISFVVQDVFPGPPFPPTKRSLKLSPRFPRAIILTLTDVLRDWRGGKLLRPKSGASDPAGAGGAAAAAPAPATGSGAGVAGGVAAAAAAALSGQELDPAGAARALRLLFERVGNSARSC